MGIEAGVELVYILMEEKGRAWRVGLKAWCQRHRSYRTGIGRFHLGERLDGQYC